METDGVAWTCRVGHADLSHAPNGALCGGSNFRQIKNKDDRQTNKTDKTDRPQVGTSQPAT